MRHLILSVTVALTLPAAAFAASPRPWVAMTGSWGTYSMSDVNNEIRAINAALADSGLALRMDEVENGFGFGAAVGLDFPGGFTLGLAYERLLASTEVSDATGGIAYQLPANAFSIRALYRLPSQTAAALSLGVGAGRVSEAGAVEVTDVGFGTIPFDFKGSGPLLEGLANGDWWATPNVAVFASAGYRYAKVAEVEVLGQTIVNPDGSKYTIDYSGLVVRLGLRAAMGR